MQTASYPTAYNTVQQQIMMIFADHDGDKDCDAMMMMIEQLTDVCPCRWVIL
jgi:hypothetical protein